MSIKEFLDSKIIDSKTIKEQEVSKNFTLIKVMDIDATQHRGCFNCRGVNNLDKLPSEAWSNLIHCSACDSLIFVYFSDRMGGNYTDVVKIYQ